MKITENTTLKELIDILGTVEKAAKTPTSKKLREEAGEPIASPFCAEEVIRAMLRLVRDLDLSIAVDEEEEAEDDE